MKIEVISNKYKIMFQIWDMEFNPALFAKSLNVKKTFVTSYEDHQRIDTPYFFIYASIEADKNNEGKNEAGIKRLERFLKSFKKHYSIEAETKQEFFNNSMPLPECLAALIK